MLYTQNKQMHTVMYLRTGGWCKSDNNVVCAEGTDIRIKKVTTTLSAGVCDTDTIYYKGR